MPNPVEIKWKGDASELLASMSAINSATNGVGSSFISNVLQPAMAVEAGVEGAGAALLGVAAAGAGVIFVAGEIGSKLLEQGEMWYDLSDKIVDSTGRTGPALNEVIDTVKHMGEEVPVSFGTLDSIMAGLLPKMQQYGNGTVSALEPVAESIATINRLAGGSDAQAEQMASSWAGLSNQFGITNLGIEAQTQSLDILYKAHQNSHASVQQLTDGMSTLGPQARALGFDFEGLAGLLGEFEKNGLASGFMAQAMSKLVVLQQKDVEKLGEAQGNQAEKETALATARSESARQVQRAHEQTANAIASAQKSIETATERAADVQEREQEKVADAVKKVSDAYEDLERTKRDVTRSIEDANTDVSRSEEDVAEAKRKQADAQATGTLSQIADAQENVRRAEERVQDAKTKVQRAQEDGFDKLVAGAKKVEDAEQDRAEAQKDADKQLERSAKELADAKISGARQVAQAHQGEADAQASAAERISKANQAVQDSVAKVEAAQKKVNVLGNDGQDIFKHFYDAIKSGDPDAIATAYDLMGTRAVKFVLAIQNGNLSLEDARNITKDASGAIQDADDHTRHFGESWQGFTNKMSEAVGPIATNFTDGMTKMIDQPVESMKYFFLDSPFGIVGSAKLASEGIYNGLAWVFDWLGKIPEWIGGVWQSIWDKIPQGFKTVFNDLASYWNEFGTHFQFNLPEFLGGAKVNLLPTVPYLAEGGVIDKKTMAVMGEYPGASTNPEIVTPENKMREVFEQSMSKFMASAGGQPPVAEQGGVIVLQIDGHEFGRAVFRTLQDRNVQFSL